MERLWQDVRYALRGMRRSPGFAAVTVLSLALGIGANTAIFSLIHTLMLRSLPVRSPEQLVEFLAQYPGDPPLNVFSAQSYQYFRESNHFFDDIAGQSPARVTVRGDRLELEAVEAEAVTGNFFQLLGVKPALGRMPGIGESGAAVLSWSYWQNRFNGDAAILGQRLVIADAPMTVVGVAAQEFLGLQVGLRPAAWIPATVGPKQGPMQLVARLSPGVSLQQARAGMAVLFQWTFEERTRNSKDPMLRQLKFSLEPAGAGLSTELRGRFANPLLALMAVVALLLLVACANVANMVLARGAGRRREMTIRIALGAGQLRLMRQMLTESALLSAAAGLLAVWLAWFGDGILVRIIESGRPIPGMGAHLQIPFRPDLRVLLFTGGVALFTALLFGLAPMWKIFPRLLGKSLVIAQVALCVGLLSAAGLFISHLSNLQHVDLGFRRDHVLLLTLDPAHSAYSAEQLTRAYQELLSGLEAIPGVRSAAISGPGPLSGAGASRFVNIEGHRERPQDRRYVSVDWVGPKYFATLGTPLLAGRDFSFSDGAQTSVAIVNQAMARYYFGEASPVGKYATFDGERQPLQIIGVAADAKYYEIRETAPRTIYLNAFQNARPGSSFALRTNIEPQSVESAVRRAVRTQLANVPVTRLVTLAEQVDASIVPERLIAMLSGVFGALGALLAAIGIYGLLGYTITRRNREIGIRMALGASPAGIYRMVLGEALVITCVGGLIGVALAWWGKRRISSLIEGLPASGLAPTVFAATAMLAIVLLAAYLPARRAALVNPVEALRRE